VSPGRKTNLQHEHLVEHPLGQEPHLMVCIHRKRKLMHQSRRTYFPFIYVLVNTFHHSTRKLFTYDAPPFMMEIPFGPSRFVS
jgi:hypothetical protein